jgi:hypothetical protein
MTDSRTDAAARHIIREAPALRDKTRVQQWVGTSDPIDFARVENELPQLGLSSGEDRLVRAALELARMDLTGLDGRNLRTVSEALSLAADACAKDATKLEELELRLTGRVSRG